MSTIERRLSALETRIKDTPLTATVHRQQMDAFYLAHRTTRERVLAEYATEGEYVYMLVMTPTTAEQPEPDDGLTPEQRYMEMIGK